MNFSAFVRMMGVLAASLLLPVSGQASLIGWWTFNDGAGNVAVDSSSGGNNGLLSGDAMFAIEGDQGVVTTAGTGGGVSWGDVPAFDGLTALTLGIWVYAAEVPSGESILVGENPGSFALSYYSNGNAYFYINGGGTNVSTALPLETWSFLVGTWDGASMTLYKDGVEVASRSASVFPDGGDLVGAGYGVPGYFPAAFSGQINEIRLYDHALSGSEVGALYLQGPVPVPEAGTLSLLLAVALLGSLRAGRNLFLGRDRRLTH